MVQVVVLAVTRLMVRLLRALPVGLWALPLVLGLLRRRGGASIHVVGPAWGLGPAPFVVVLGGVPCVLVCEG